MKPPPVTHPERRALAQTGMQVSALGLGTVELGMDYGIRAPGQFGQPSDAAAVALLHRAADAGVRFFDTAPGYGAAERLVGEALGEREECVLATKVTIASGTDGRPLRGEALRRDLGRSLAKSRRALRRDTLDVVQIHNATVAALAAGELAEVLLEARQVGEVRALGASVYTEAEALAAIDAGCFDVLQVPYNLLDRRMEAVVFPRARAAGVAIVARSAFLKGALTTKGRHLPTGLGELAAAADRMRSTLGVTWEALASVALRFCLFAPHIATVIVGVRTEAEVNAAIAAVKAGPLPAEIVKDSAALALTDPGLVDPSQWCAL